MDRIHPIVWNVKLNGYSLAEAYAQALIVVRVPGHPLEGFKLLQDACFERIRSVEA
jgi:hypothetical protein